MFFFIVIILLEQLILAFRQLATVHLLEPKCLLQTFLASQNPCSHMSTNGVKEWRELSDSTQLKCEQKTCFVVVFLCCFFSLNFPGSFIDMLVSG